MTANQTPENPTTPDKPRRKVPRTRLGRIVHRALWCASWMVALALVPLCAAWLFAGAGFEADLVANLTAQSAMVATLLALWWLVRRRWARLGVAAACAALAFAGVLTAPRAARAVAPADPARIVRVLTMNAYAWNRHPEGLMTLLETTDADVVTILEPPTELLQGMRASETLQAKYPNRQLPEHAEAGARIMLCRWPVERLRRRDVPGEPNEPDWRYHGRSWRIDGPAPFVLSMIHPESPRNRLRWKQGNEDIEMIDLAMANMVEPLGLPVIVAGDFNATPTGWRSRQITRTTGLRRAKPWSATVGTWPAWSLWPARIAIDDVMVSEGVGVISWKTQTPPPIGKRGALNSDHIPVRVELLIPPGRRPSEPSSP